MVATAYKKSVVLFVALMVILPFFLASSALAAGSVSLLTNSVVRGDPLRVSWSGFSGNVNIAVYRGKDFWIYTETNAPGSGFKDLYTDGWDLRSDYKVKVELRSNTGISTTSSVFSVTTDGPKAPSGLRIMP